MGTDEKNAKTDWQAVIGRSLAFLCLHAADLRKEKNAVQGAMLRNLGMSWEDAARVTGSSANTLMSAASKSKKGGKKSGKSKARKLK